MPVLIVRFVNGCDERVSKPVIKARAGRLSCYLAKFTRRDVVFAKHEFEDFKQCPPACPEFPRHHDDRDHRRPRSAGLISEPVPEPRPLRIIWIEPREKGPERLDLT